MKLFMIVLEKDGKAGEGFDVLAHNVDAAAARAFVAPKFTGYTIVNLVELDDAPKHFVVTEWDSKDG